MNTATGSAARMSRPAPQAMATGSTPRSARLSVMGPAIPVPSALVSTPPSTRPTASPAVSVAVKIPIARARACPV
jgi:hypothetical protein